jgi:hypothetical protein
MTNITIKVACKWRLKYAHNYIFDSQGNCYNSKTNRKLKQCYQSRCIGYNIKGKFKSLSFLRDQLEKIPQKDFCPF